MKHRRLALLALLIVAGALLIVAAGSVAGGAVDTRARDSSPGMSAAGTPQTIQYTYDAAGRLVQVSYGSGQRITYTYDAAGNLLRRSVSAGLQNLYLPVVLKAAH